MFNYMVVLTVAIDDLKRDGFNNPDLSQYNISVSSCLKKEILQLQHHIYKNLS